jgi:UDP-3-O-[3-hydroxymyristoyl] glucosamine N-acyltransferase
MQLTLAELTARTGGQLSGNPDRIVTGAAAFETAGSNDITYAESSRYLKELNACTAGAIVVPRGTDAGDIPAIEVSNPRVVFAEILDLFYPPEVLPAGISPQSSVGREVSFGSDCAVSPHVSIGERVAMGSRVTLYPGVVIGNDVRIGDDVRLYPNVVVASGCRIGSRVVINAGTVVGSDGFGFAPDGERYRKIPQLGRVVIDDDVELGALNAIDRATFGETHIARGVKTDNLVHIAHNVSVGEDTLLVAQVGIAGSTEIGRHVILAGQTGVAGHIRIGDNSMVAAQSGIPGSLEPGSVVSGTPAMPHRVWLKVSRILTRLPGMKQRLERLEKKVQHIEESL